MKKKLFPVLALILILPFLVSTTFASEITGNLSNSGVNSSSESTNNNQPPSGNGGGGGVVTNTSGASAPTNNNQTSVTTTNTSSLNSGGEVLGASTGPTSSGGNAFIPSYTGVGGRVLAQASTDVEIQVSSTTDTQTNPTAQEEVNEPVVDVMSSSTGFLGMDFGNWMWILLILLLLILMIYFYLRDDTSIRR